MRHSTYHASRGAGRKAQGTASTGTGAGAVGLILRTHDAWEPPVDFEQALHRLGMLVVECRAERRKPETVAQGVKRSRTEAPTRNLARHNL
jgi:hypothetical protein